MTERVKTELEDAIVNFIRVLVEDPMAEAWVTVGDWNPDTPPMASEVAWQGVVAVLGYDPLEDVA